MFRYRLPFPKPIFYILAFVLWIISLIITLGMINVSLILGQDEEPGRILAMVNRHIQLLLKTQDLLKIRTSKEETAKKLGVSPYFVTNYIEQARGIAAPFLWRNMSALLAADLALKSSGRRNQGAIMDLLVARLCSS